VSGPPSAVPSGEAVSSAALRAGSIAARCCGGARVVIEAVFLLDRGEAFLLDVLALGKDFLARRYEPLRERDGDDEEGLFARVESAPRCISW
jgi:hypothetical protein